ncbi:phosphatase PAP2 family protein [Paraflavisolibacter sp. H34]|uniref:phosphatase PAP2 family protein n=1 Tax=Huijunlia imazamoxiresistens TaxID=3127457 RepID=UPI0030178D8D
MFKAIFTGLVFCLLGSFSYGQGDTAAAPKQEGLALVPPLPAGADGQIYRLRPGRDIPLTAAAAAWSGYAFTQIYSKDDTPEATIRNLKKSDINGFDRWGADVYSRSADKISDYPFYIAMPLPLVLLADHKIRQDGLKIAFLYLEAMSVTGLLYTGATYTVDRFRPLAYNDKVPMGERREGGAKNSFFAGHVALVATSSFFVAKVYGDYHPDSKILKPVLYATAIAATGATAYLRHMGGKHFPSDIVLGTAVGTLSGILVPHLHKNKLIKNPNLSITPFSTGRAQGLSLVYKIR